MRRPPGQGPGGQLNFGVLIEKPPGILLKHGRQLFQERGGGNALPGLDHAEVGDGGGHGGIQLDTACRKILQGQSVALPQAADLRPQKVTLAQQT